VIPLEERVGALEKELAELKAILQGKGEASQPWWRDLWGIFAGDPAFKEAMRLGRAYRESTRPKPRQRRTR
jgi:hypothetical protein